MLGAQEIEKSRELHADALSKLRPELEAYFEPIGGLAVVHEVIVVAVPDRVNEAKAAFSILTTRLETFDPGTKKMWSDMPLKQKLPLFLRRNPVELDGIESAYEWDKAMVEIYKPIDLIEVAEV